MPDGSSYEVDPSVAMRVWSELATELEPSCVIGLTYEDGA